MTLELLATTTLDDSELELITEELDGASLLELSTTALELDDIVEELDVLPPPTQALKPAIDKANKLIRSGTFLKLCIIKPSCLDIFLFGQFIDALYAIQKGFSLRKLNFCAELKYQSVI